MLLSRRLQDPANALGFVPLLVAYFCTHKYADAIQGCKVWLDMAPNSLRGHEMLAMASALSGRYEEAIAVCERMSHLSGGARGRPLLGYSYALAGRLKEARSVLEELNKSSDKNLFLLFYTAVPVSGRKNPGT